MIVKDLLYIVLLIFLYRAFFRPKVVVEHRHFYNKKTDTDKKTKPKIEDYTDYEEIK